MRAKWVMALVSIVGLMAIGWTFVAAGMLTFWFGGDTWRALGASVVGFLFVVVGAAILVDEDDMDKRVETIIEATRKRVDERLKERGG